MTWKVQRNIFGISFDLDIDFELPLQKIYSLRLKFDWFWYSKFKRSKSKDFVHNALRNLPEGSFIVFSFDEEADSFVQLANMGGSIVMDIPLWATNNYFGRDEEVVKLLRSMHFVRSSRKSTRLFKKDHFDIISDDQNHEEIRASFGGIFTKAANATLRIAEEIFGINTPTITYYVTDKLMPAN